MRGSLSRMGVLEPAVCVFGVGAGWLVGSVPVGLQTSVVSAIGGGWSSRAEFGEGAIGGPDRIREYRCLGFGVHIVSHSGSWKPRIILSQQKLRFGRFKVG